MAHVVVVLVLRRLLRLGLDQEGALEPDPVLVLGDHVQEPGELRLLAGQVRVEQGLVALATAPQDVVRAAQPMGRLEHRLDLGRGEGEDLRIRVRGGARRVARMAEQVGGSPQELEARSLHVALDGRHGFVQVRLRLGKRPALWRDVAVVEAEERDAQLAQELERGIQPAPGREHRVEAGIEPGSVERAGAEDVRTRPAEGMPQADRDPEVIRHSLAQDQPIRLVDLERERVGRIETAEWNPLRDIRKELTFHAAPPWAVSAPSARRAVVYDATSLSRTFVQDEHKPASTVHLLSCSGAASAGQPWLPSGRGRTCSGRRRSRARYCRRATAHEPGRRWRNRSRSGSSRARR